MALPIDLSTRENNKFIDVGNKNTSVRTTLTGSDGVEAGINASGQLKVVLDGKVDTDNSTSTPLAVDATFTGVAVETLDYALIFITVYSDVASATDGLTIEMSSDGTTWHSGQGDKFTVPAATQKTYSIQPHSRYYRVKYTNGSTLQATFDLQAVLKKTNSKASSHRIQDSISEDDDATLQKSVLTALSDNGSFVNIEATASNNLKVANVEDGLSIAKGDVTGATYVHKFGNAPDFDSDDGEVNIWDGADDADIAEMQYNYSSTADIDSIVSSNAGDTVDIEIQGLDASYDLVVQTVTLTGQTRVALTTSLIRVFRLKNVGDADLSGNVYCYVDTTLSGGVPVDTTKVRAVIDNGNNQTEMALYTVPLGKTAYLRSWYASSAGAKKTTNYVVRLKARPFGQVFQLKHRTAISDGFPYNHPYTEPEVFSAKTDIAMTAELAASGVTGAAVSAGFDIVLIDN